DLVGVASPIPSPVLSVMAAMLTARRNRDEHLIILPANLLAQTQTRLVDTVKALVDFSGGEIQHIGVLGYLAGQGFTKPDDKHRIAIAPMARAQWCPVEHVYAGSAVESGLHEAVYCKPIGVIVAAPVRMIETVHEKAPIITQACSHAISTMVDEEDGIQHVKDSFLTLAGNHTIETLLSAKPHRLRVLPVDQTVTAAESWADRLALELSATDSSRPSCQIAGYDDAVRIDYANKTLVLEPGREREIKIERPGTETGRLALAKPHYTLFHSRTESDVWLLDLPAGTNRETECHFTRSETLQVLEGRPTITIDAIRTVANPGDVFCIPQGSLHRVANDGANHCVIMETRIGAILDDDDRLRVPDAQMTGTDTLKQTA
ncbi:MAG: cupin domain-containing protein, partial [Pseudomonadota bacterium]